MIGVLAIQGDFSAHGHVLSRLGENWREIRNVSELNGISGLIIPGGESTAMLHLLGGEWPHALSEFARKGYPIFGTCAGAILLARQVLNPTQRSLGLVDVSIIRNAYGRQVHSFVAKTLSSFGSPELEMIFIRAPRIGQTGSRVKILAELDGSPVLVQHGQNLLATFHPELTTDVRTHQHFLSMVRKTL